MTLLPLVFVLLSAAPEHQVSLAFPGLNPVNLMAGEGPLRTEVLAARLTARGIKVITSRDLSTVLGVERQKELLGCAESSCAVEMLAAAGADVVLVGDLGNLGGQYTLTLKALSTKDGKLLATHVGQARTEKELAQLFDDAAGVIAAAVLPKGTVAPGLVGEAGGSTHPFRAWSVLPAVVGVLAVGSGVAFKVLGDGNYKTLTSPPVTNPESLAQSGKLYDGVMVGSFIGAGVALAVAVVLFFLPGSEQTALRLFGGGEAFAGVWP